MNSPMGVPGPTWVNSSFSVTRISSLPSRSCRFGQHLDTRLTDELGVLILRADGRELHATQTTRAEHVVGPTNDRYVHGEGVHLRPHRAPRLGQYCFFVRLRR